MTHELLKFPGTYIETSLNKIKGYNPNWLSLITSNPLLFEDLDYLRIKRLVLNDITDVEKEAYKSGKLRKLYGNFDLMLMDNLQYYDRIMSFCTIIFMKYIRIDSENTTSHELNNIPYYIDATPTQIWCGALASSSSTKFELEYGYSTKLKYYDEDVLGNNFKILNTNPLFSKFASYRAYINNTNGYRETLLNDKTSDTKLYNICRKFTESSPSIGYDQLNDVLDYYNEITQRGKELFDPIHKILNSLYNSDETQFSIYVYLTRFYIHTSKFSMKVFKTNESISKEYLSNSYECFAVEPYLSKSVKQQISWFKYKTPENFSHIIDSLKTLLNKLLNENFREVTCFKRMNDYGCVSVITFSGVFDNVYITENFMLDNKIIKSNKLCLSKNNAAKWIIEEGYVLFGYKKDVSQLLKDIDEKGISRELLINHYTKYCVNILDYMRPVIGKYEQHNNDILNVVLNDEINVKLHNDEIKYTNLVGIGNANRLVRSINDRIKSDNQDNVKSYWEVIK